MWRYYYTIARKLFKLPGALLHMDKMIDEYKKDPSVYDENKYYDYVRYVVDEMRTGGHIETKVFGLEDLPKEGGYVMYPNHEGKWDVYGIISVHNKPMTFVMDIKKSNWIFIRQLVDMLKGKRLDKENNRQAMTIINEVAKEVAKGKKCILFPEGIYDNKKKNSLIDFKPGCFKICLKSKVPIIPVVLIDSYKPYNSWQLGKITTQVHYLKPILYDEYKDMNTQQIAELVKGKIADKIQELK
jgi:1-acyl-sn-glycerol-3-phosphate acyltransferase